MAELTGGISKLYKELRRRNVFRVTTVYLIASWILIQIAETTFPALNLPGPLHLLQVNLPANSQMMGKLRFSTDGAQQT